MESATHRRLLSNEAEVRERCRRPLSLKLAHHRYASSYATMPRCNIPTYSSWNVFTR
jgi:hypothetical protein